MNSNSKKKTTFIIVAILLFAILADLINLRTIFNRMLIGGIIIVPVVYYLLTINLFQKKGLIAIFLYLILGIPNVLYALIFDNEYLVGTPLLLFYLIAFIFGVIIYKTRYKTYYIAFYLMFFLSGSYFFNDVHNYYIQTFKKTNISEQTLPDISIKNENNSIQKIKTNNKVQVIDFWSNNCGYCIESFPKFEKLHQHYKNANDIDIYAININKGSNKEIEKAKSLLKNYNFKNYFTDPSIYKTLKFNGVPNYMIINKSGKIVYFGSLNDGLTENYNNIYKLIENER